ncbi:MAG: PIN domain-containing protein [Ignavibacteria bacterium]
MILADTSIWVEFLKGNENTYSVLKGLLENREVLVMECIFGELLQGAKIKREKEIILDYWRYMSKEDEKEIWIDAGKYSSENSLIEKGIGLIDSAIISFARRHSAKIWSLDKKLKSVLNKNEIFP